MNLNPELSTIIVWIAAIAVAVLVVYAILLSIANRRSQVNSLRKRSDIKGLARIANDPAAAESVRLDAINALAQLETAPGTSGKILNILLEVFTSAEGEIPKGVVAALLAMDARFNNPAFREIVLQHLDAINWKLLGKTKQHLILVLLRKFSATRTEDGKPHPVSVHALEWMGMLASDEKLFSAVLDALQNFLDDPESNVHFETVRTLTTIALQKPNPKVQERVTEILASAHQNPNCTARLSAIHALGKLAVESRSIRLRSLVTSSLVIGLQDEDTEVRSTAVELLKQLNTQSAATETRARIADALILALHNSDLKIRQQALDALGETYLWAETPERLERTVKALIVAMYDGNKAISRRAAKMLAKMEPQIEEEPLRNQLYEAFLAALQSPDEEIRFHAAETLMALYQSDRLPEALRALVRAQKETIQETGILSTDNRLGKCPICGKNVLLKQARLLRRVVPAGETAPEEKPQTTYRYFCRECYIAPEGQDWPPGALRDPEGAVIEDHRPPASEPWWEDPEK